VAGCGEVNVDGVVVPLDCFTKDYVKVEGASQSLSRASLQSAATALPDYVDHRRDNVEGPVRHQRTVGDAAAFALASAIDQALIRNGGGFSPVSPMHLWARAPRPNLGQIVRANVGKGVASEATLPYNEARACAWASPEAARLCKAPKKGEAPKPEEIAAAEGAPFARLTDLVEVDPHNTDVLREALAKNQDVLAVLRVDPDAWRSVVKSPDPEPLIPDYTGTGGVQPVTIVGYAKQDNTWFLLIKNSWGPAWGKDGYAWMQENTFKRNVIEGYLVHATVAAGPTTGTGPTTCPPNQVPDAVTKQCTPPCPDKSPRTNGVCPDPKNACPAGFVNTTGRCVVAAPDRSGVDATTNVAYACGPAGCTYTWQKGTLGCLEATCSLSCASPKFLAAINVKDKTISCTE
jgi:hypothetical protein